MKDAENDTLDDILEDEPTAEAPPEEEIVEEDQPEEIETPEEEPAPEPQMVPLDALTESRAKTRELEEQLAALQKAPPQPDQGMMQQMQALQQQVQKLAQPQQQPQQMPDPLEDPAAYTQALQQNFQQQMNNMQLNFSERMARQQYGDEHVNQALEAAQMQGLVGTFQNTPDPWVAMAKWHNDQQQLAVISQAGGIDKFKEQLRAEWAAEQQAEQVADTIIPAAPSLAGETSVAPRKRQAPTEESLDDILGPALPPAP